MKNERKNERKNEIENKSKKIPKMSEAMWLLGTVLVALGVSICKKADLGVSMIAAPPFIIYEAIAGFWSGFSVGMVEYLTQGMLLIILCLIIKRFDWRFLLAFVVAIIYGMVLDLWLFVLKDVSFSEPWLRWVMLFVGDIITATGVACYFRTYLPLQVYELFVAELSNRFKLNISKTKWVFDMSGLCISILLATTLFGDIATFDWKTIYISSYHSIGLGTIVTTFINAPILTFSGKLLDKCFVYTPLSLKLEKCLKRS